MSEKAVLFRYLTGLKSSIFSNARLRGSWDENRLYSDNWTEQPMQPVVCPDGCPGFETIINLDPGGQAKVFKWMVSLDGPQGSNLDGIATEVQDVNSNDRYRSFQLDDTTGDDAGGATPQVEEYYLTYLRRLGANKFYPQPGQDADPALRFAVWAPNAQSVRVVFGDSATGYIGDDGGGIDASVPAIALVKGKDGIWESPANARPRFADYDSRVYMYEIVNAQGTTVYRTDIFSRNQVGRGDIVPNPARDNWPGTLETLDGPVSCSQVVDPDLIFVNFERPMQGAGQRVSPTEFWAAEFTQEKPVPTRVEDLVIYELHIGALWNGTDEPGNLGDAMEFLDHLTLLGINAVELLPMAEFSGEVSWGYGDTHHLVIESSAGGRDQYRHFVRECHRRGLAVIQDVVYNHYDGHAERAEWQYDSVFPEQNIYYWYEGLPYYYTFSEGGYLNNGSSGYSPRFWEETVRQQFVSSAAYLVEELHVDGIRVDLTQAIHRDNTLNSNGNPVNSANIFGQKLLRELTRTLRLLKPGVIIIAEDHTGWDKVTMPLVSGGLGFDATWYADFYHNLIGDDNSADGKARLLKIAGTGGNEPLALAQFSGVFWASQFHKVVYHESHDEAGNAGGSNRTMVTAVNGAALWGATRSAAEARSRTVFGLSLLSGGTPMFLMAEEVAATAPYTVFGFLSNRVNIVAERQGWGANMFRFYQDLITLRRDLAAFRTQSLHVVYQSSDNRVILFKRWKGTEEILVFASLNNAPFSDGYQIQADTLSIPDRGWKEIFNSDASIYGGANTGNAGAIIPSAQGRLNVRIPANGLVVFSGQ